MRLLHTADLHLGCRFVSLGEKGGSQRRQLLDTFDAIVELAVSEAVDAILVAGDLFDSNTPSATTVERVKAASARLCDASIPVFVIPGTHDCGGPSSIWRSLELGPTVTVFLETGHRTLPELDLVVHALVIQGKKAPEDAFSLLRRSGEASVEVGMAHGSLAIPGLIDRDDLLIQQQEAADTGLDYLALGHWHSFRTDDCGSVVACYPGAPEMIALDQRGAGRVAMVTLEKGKRPKVEARQVGRRRFESLNLRVDGLGSREGIERQVREKADRDLVLDVTLSGLCSLDLDISADRLEAELADSFFVLNVTDKTHPPLDDTALAGLSPQTVAGRFCELMRERIQEAGEDEAGVYEEALRLGVALLEGRQVLE